MARALDGHVGYGPAATKAHARAWLGSESARFAHRTEHGCNYFRKVSFRKYFEFSFRVFFGCFVFGSLLSECMFSKHVTEKIKVTEK